MEKFFSCVRLQGGGNNNLNALPFKHAVRKLLYRNRVKPSTYANCTDDDLELSPISEFRSEKRSILETQVSDLHKKEQLDTLMYYIESNKISYYKMNVLYYITGHFVNKIIDKISCQSCRDILLMSNDHIDHNYFVDITNFSSLTAFMDRGGLKYVSRFAFEVIKYSEKLFISEMSHSSFKNTSKN